MGLLNKKRVTHYWCKVEGVYDPVIKSAMTKSRFDLITSALSFARPSPHAKSGWFKFHYVDSVVKAACRAAVGITQHIAIDESMIKCYSRYCSWKQFMPRKPIKTGIKVFALVLSIGFLYNWHVYRGAADTLSGKNAMYTLINNLLLTYIFNNAGCIVFCDAAFTSLRLFRQLYSRGIYAVGPINAKKPEKGGGKNSWPHQNFKKGDVEYLARGWDRTAFSKLDGGDYIQATVWRDNKFVKLLNTVYIVDGVETVTRWIRSARDYAVVSTRLVLKMYQRHMGHVDRVDKNVALSAIRLRRCKKRYHRHLFLWLIASVGFNNVLVLFCLLYPMVEILMKKQEASGFGWKHWFQLELSSTLIKRGTEMCNVRRRTKAVRVFSVFFRSGEWKSKWRDFHANHCSCCTRTPAVADATAATPTPAVSKTSRARRGRPKGKKVKRRSGGGHNKRKGSPLPKPQTKRELRRRQLQRERLETYDFQSPPPFVPRVVGRKRKAPVGDSVFANGRTHTLVHSSTLNKWSKVSDLCVCCYARAPPPPQSGAGRGVRKKFMSDGSRIPATSFACDACGKRLCKYCHHHVWGPHLKGGSIPHGIVYSAEM